ncbi:pyrrolidone-carboxylate peptidase [Saccharothrix saharensis]|uniref:Pyrrolidone-carboxylate peptidase n=1 Tax=Saccharothrix saharensis TaxID=571190 RepID=A0A543JGX3_9PSEU|nr:pyrrolidone-carboxylate peptidase [Saccharothrix saharensis]
MTLTLGLSLLTLPAVAHAQPAPCFDPNAPLTVEEQRLDDRLTPTGPEVGPELVRLAGFDDDISRFTARLCEPISRAQALYHVVGRGAELWRAAVQRAQSAQAWDSYDDRPLYWARLQATKALRQWQPRDWRPDAAERARLVELFDRTSRGVEDVRFADGVRRIAVTGFDPFQLSGTSVRRSNPAGAAALRLDGKVVDTPSGPAVVEAAVLPVLWGAFDRGVVERFYGTALNSRANALVTVSQGRPGQFDVERWAGRWRGGFPDNDDVSSRGVVPDAAGWPQPALEFIETTLPHERLVAATTGPFPVRYNREFCEWPLGTVPGTGTPSCRTDEPTPGAAAASGSGGDYLSNESMYRANRLRLGLSATAVLGGHLHTPVLGQPVDPTALTDAAFERDRRVIADQVAALVSVI